MLPEVSLVSTENVESITVGIAACQQFGGSRPVTDTDQYERWL